MANTKMVGNLHLIRSTNTEYCMQFEPHPGQSRTGVKFQKSCKTEDEIKNTLKKMNFGEEEIDRKLVELKKLRAMIPGEFSEDELLKLGFSKT